VYLTLTQYLTLTPKLIPDLNPEPNPNGYGRQRGRVSAQQLSNLLLEV